MVEALFSSLCRCRQITDDPSEHLAPYLNKNGIGILHFMGDVTHLAREHFNDFLLRHAYPNDANTAEEIFPTVQDT